MGKEWLFWGGGGGGKSTKKPAAERESTAEVAAPTGCMCAVLQLFDLHQVQFALHHQSSFRQAGPFLHDELPANITNVKGIEAPRNSLELDEPLVQCDSSSSSSSTRGKQQQENLNIPVTIQIKTTRENVSPRTSFSKSTRSRTTTTDDLFSDSCSGTDSPAAGGNKTPTLVARLMGLDQLPPESTTPHATTTTMHLHHSLRKEQRHNRSCSQRSFYENEVAAGGSGTLSLPETPRISSARRSDVDHGHRLSLQINKENISEEFETSASTAVKNLARKRRQQQADEEHRRSGASDYAKEIVKQMKESVSRKVGLLDITNTIKSSTRTTDDHVVLLKPKKPSKGPHESTSSCSPKLLNPDSYKPLNGKNHASQPSLQQQSSSVVKKCKKDGNAKYMRRNSQVPEVLMKKKEDPFVRPTTAHKGNNVTDHKKKSKKTPISTDIFNISVPTLLPVKKQQSQASSDDAEQVLRKSSGTQISSCSSQAYKLRQQQVTSHTLNFQENNTCHHRTPTSTSSGEKVVELEYRYYIQRILKRAGIDKATPVSLAKWYNPSRPLDPSIFHYIELFHPAFSKGAGDSDLSLRCNRKLAFQVADELLAEILKPYLIAGSRVRSRPRGQMYGSQLIDTLCSRIKKFPRADCKVLEDIDALIGTDLEKTTTYDYGEEEEGEGIVEEIQREIVKSLVNDTIICMI